MIFKFKIIGEIVLEARSQYVHYFTFQDMQSDMLNFEDIQSNMLHTFLLDNVI